MRAAVEHRLVGGQLAAGAARHRRTRRGRTVDPRSNSTVNGGRLWSSPRDRRERRRLRDALAAHRASSRTRPVRSRSRGARGEGDAAAPAGSAEVRHVEGVLFPEAARGAFFLQAHDPGVAAGREIAGEGDRPRPGGPPAGGGFEAVAELSRSSSPSRISPSSSRECRKASGPGASSIRSRRRCAPRCLPRS